jgi:hypothetical protein
VNILLLDISSTTTGWAIVNTATGEVVATGHFTVNKKGLKVEDGAAYINQVCSEVYHKTLLVLEGHAIDEIVYEVTDWHRSLFRRGITRKQQLIDYSIERRTQWSLGQMAGTMAVFNYLHKYPVYSVGVNVVKNWIGEKDKMAVARWVAANWQDRFAYVPEVKNRPLLDLKTGANLSHHISDALALGAYVLYLGRTGQLL